MDSRRKSLAKALSWRMLAVVITAAVAYVFTDDPAFAVKIGLADSGLKLLIYYVHERAWARASLGRRSSAPGPSTTAPPTTA